MGSPLKRTEVEDEVLICPQPPLLRPKSEATLPIWAQLCDGQQEVLNRQHQTQKNTKIKISRATGPIMSFLKRRRTSDRTVPMKQH